jgi:hypothetical protein
MLGLGSSAHLLGKIWPELRMASPSPLKLKLRAVLQHKWILARLTDAADLWTEHQVPNPLMEKVLSLHSTLGYRQAAEREDPTTEAACLTGTKGAVGSVETAPFSGNFDAE